MAHLSWIPDFPLHLRLDHTHPRTTPTRSMAMTALSMPSPPPSAVVKCVDDCVRRSLVDGGGHTVPEMLVWTTGDNMLLFILTANHSSILTTLGSHGDVDTLH